MTGGAVECCQQISIVDYVNDTKRQTPFIAADGHAKTQRISESSCSVVNKLLRSKYVDNSKHRLRLYQSTVTPERTEQNLFVRYGKSEKPK